MEPENQQLGKQFTGFETPPFPTTSSEFITILTQFHRAEISRMAGWRDRIDRTTNWAITAVAAMLSLSLSSLAHHGILLFAMLIILLLLFVESRRYRFFDVYRSRVRLIERYYFAPIFMASRPIDNNWAQILGQDLLEPRFLMSFGAAMSRRLRRNYVWMFPLLLIAWILKISTPKLQLATPPSMSMSFYDIVRNSALGPFPGWFIMTCVAMFYGWIAYIALHSPKYYDELSHGNVHV